MYKVKIASIEEFRESKDIWDALALRMYLPSIFCTWEWIYTWWEHFGKDYELLILFVYNEAELKGILPLASRKMTVKNSWLTGRILTYCGSMELYPDHLDIIASSEDANNCITAVFDFLFSTFKEWDVFHVLHVSEGNHLFSWRNDENSFIKAEIQPVSVAPYISLSNNFDEYYKTLSANLRKNIKKRERKLFEENNFKYAACEKLNIHDGLKALFDLHAERAERKNITSTFADKNIIEFHTALSHRIAKNDWVWIRSIRNEAKTIAASYCYAFGDRVFAYQKGIDPEWGKYGTGTLINYETIKEAFCRGYKEFDFLRGNEEHKSNWTQKHRLLLNINVFNRTFKGLLSSYFHRINLALKKLKKIITSFMVNMNGFYVRIRNAYRL